jgi:GNAT superfamily N-acetyltransferase
VTTSETPEAAEAIRVVPANEAPWADLQAVFGSRGTPATCQCQWFKLRNSEWHGVTTAERTERFREQTGCGDPQAATSGLVAYLGDEAAGWCAVEPRPAYPRLATSRMVWAGRDEDRDDAGVWSVTCFVTRVGYRRRGVSRALAVAAAEFARDHGARAVEGYAKLVEPGRRFAADFYVGTVGTFAAAGFAEVSRPTPNRAVMRIDFRGR